MYPLWMVILIGLACFVGGGVLGFLAAALCVAGRDEHIYL